MLTGRSSPVEMVAPARQATDGVIDMDNPADNLDQTDEDILTYTVSDEAIEAAAGEDKEICPSLALCSVLSCVMAA